MRDNLFRIVSLFNIIIYARLSKEEEGKTLDEKSKSIMNQIDICRRYIVDEQRKYSHIKFKIVAELYDDGISGTTFDRDNFRELINLIETKKANMVITKDQSRFGREHIETDNYMEKWFPEHNVRYVSVLDGVDTYIYESANNDIAPIKNWMNEMYAKHTSRAVKATKRENAKKGIWNGGEPPLGFKIDVEHSGCLMIDPVGAEIVKRIFNLALDNKSIFEISNLLIKDGVPIPSVVKGNKRNLNLNLIDFWNSNTVKSILSNEMYKGTMVQCKTTTLSHKSKKIIYLPKEDWVRVPNKVPTIVDEKTFDNVQILIGYNKNKTRKSYDYLLKGLLKCKECNHTIGIQHFNKRKNNYTVCNYYRKYGKRKDLCSAHRFNYEELEFLILNCIKKDCFQYINISNILFELKNRKKNIAKKDELIFKIEKCKNEIDKLNMYLDRTYKRLDNEIIDDEQFYRIRKQIDNDVLYNKNCIKCYENELMDILNKNSSQYNYNKAICEFLSLSNPNKLIITKLIKAIYISENGNIEIYYRIKNPCLSYC